MGRKRVFLAGPISRGDLAENINRATAAFVALARAGLAPFCPHWSCYAGEAMVRPSTGSVYALASPLPNGLSYDDWLAVGLAWLAAADAVLRLPGESPGADREAAEAGRLGVPVFDSVAGVLAHFRGS